MKVRTALSEVIISSPLTLLEEHVKACASCVEQLPDFFEAAHSGKWSRAEKIQGRVADLESAADELKGDVRQNMPRGLWMSVSRTDLLELVRMQDKMANDTKDVVGLSLGRELAFPAALEKSVSKYISTVLDCVNAAVEVVAATRELSRSAFGTRQLKSIASRVASVERLERKTDQMQSRLRSKLRVCEEKLSPVDVIFLYQLLTQIGDIADSAEKVAHRAFIIANS